MKSNVISLITLIMAPILMISHAYAWEPLAYPYEVFGKVYNNNVSGNGVEDGTYFEVYAEQGIDIMKVKQSTLNVYGGLDVVRGGDSNLDYWNDVTETTGGVRFRFDLGEGVTRQWGNVNVGASISNKKYSSNPDGDDTETSYRIFVSFGMGGDWKQ